MTPNEIKKKSKILMLTLGFDERFVYRAVLRHDVSEGDEIILITGKRIDKVQRAFEMISNFVKKSYGETVEVKLIEIDPLDVYGSIRKIGEVLKGIEERSLLVNLSGGMRALILIVIFSVLLMWKRNFEVEVELEDLSGIVRFPGKLLKVVGSLFPASSIELLKMIREGVCTTEKLAKSLRKERSTIRKRLKRLEEAGLIEIVRKKPLTVKLTELGKLIIDLEQT